MRKTEESNTQRSERGTVEKRPREGLIETDERERHTSETDRGARERGNEREKGGRKKRCKRDRGVRKTEGRDTQKS